MDLVAFYHGEGPDYQGRTLREIWEWNDDRLEERHDYIQVLFPLQERSQFNALAPILDAAALAGFRADETIRANLLQSLRVMLRFYGFQMDEKTGAVVEAPNFAARAAEWLFPDDHNHLRITRILKCLTMCGLQAEATAFLRRLEAVADPSRVTRQSLHYWRQAVRSA
ncbi:MAG TPA: opioid growth factor receptor-related protein [Gemmataceae bacterium]|nr:opioid growth factor receptor-related protein [Gemmataceae bacterium]